MKEFFHMGGYALYVWGSFGATAVLMIAEPWLLGVRKRNALARVRRLIRMREEKQQSPE
jgi:heme exporter protein D